MNPKQIILLIVVLGLLVFGLYWKGQQTRPELSPEPEASFGLGVSPENLDGLQIYKETSEERLMLTRVGENWVLPNLWGLPADANRVDRLLQGLEEVGGDERGNSEDLFADFGIRDAQAIHVLLSENGEVKEHLLIGDKTAGWNQVFVRREGSEKVYLCDWDLLSRMGIYADLESAKIEPLYVANLKLFSIAEDNIESVSVRRSGGEWRPVYAGNPFEQDEAKTKNYHRALRGLRAETVVDPAGEGYGLDTPEYEVQIALKEGDPVVAQIGAPVPGSGNGERYLRVENSPHVYTVASYTQDNLAPDPSRFVGANPLQIQKQDLLKVTVHTPSREISVDSFEDAGEALTQYIEALSRLSIVRVRNASMPQSLSDPAQQAWILIEQQGKDPVRLIADPLAEGMDETPCLVEGGKIPFTISKPTYEKLFANLSRLQEIESEPEAQPEAEPETSEPTPAS
ncbi:MAG: DUF4340 domain-containing protein [Candidatus Omnitrophica bacterium]|nr:DUF4340 domain-containing protein [Candidatus Omnitrophota bacterium]